MVNGLPEGADEMAGCMASICSSVSSCASSHTSTSTVKPRPELFERAMNSMLPPFFNTMAS